MGIVFEAKDIVLGRKVALKVILPAQGGDAAQVQEETDRFMREARLSANLSKHPHIVGVYDAGAVDGRPYLAMEFIDGSPLSKWRRTGEANLPDQVRILRDVARGVHHAHQHGVIHRDLKPDNILLSTGNQPHVTDFGLAKNLNPETSAALTAKGQVMGTPIYMSPEQADGHPSIDHRTDIYSLGVILYEALAGRPPFLGKSAVDILVKVVGEAPPSPSSLTPSGSVDPRLEAICLKAIAKLPSKRHPSAEALAADLEGWLGSRGAAPAPVSAPVSVPVSAPKPAALSPAPSAPASVPAPKSAAAPASSEAPPKAPPEPAAAVPVSSRRGSAWARFGIVTVLVLGAGAAYIYFVVPRTVRQILIARALSSIGQDEEALRIYDEILAKSPSLPEAVARRKEILGRLALAPRKADAPARPHEPAVVVPPPPAPPAPAVKKDAGPVRGVTELLAQHPGAVDDAFVSAVERLSPEDQAAAVLEKLKELHPAWNGKAKHKIELGKVVEWTAVSSVLTDLSPLRALPDLTALEIHADWDGPTNRFIKGRLTDLSALRGMALHRLRIPGASVRDLSVLHGMPLAMLRCDWTDVSDLTPLVGTPLNSLDIAATPVTDLSPLSGLPLEVLNCAGTRISDLTPLRTTLSLKKLFIRNSKVTDFGPIRYCPLSVLKFDYVADRDGSLVRSMTTLVDINDFKAAEFLALYAHPWDGIFDGRSTGALVLSPNKDGWLFERDVLTSSGKDCTLLTREDFGDGEFRIRYRSDSGPFVSIAVRHSAEKGYSVVSEPSPAGAPRGRVRDHEVIFTCKEDQVTALLDGQPAPLKFKNGPRRGPIQIHVMGGGHFSLLSIERR
jgi:hypothetical protein